MHAYGCIPPLVFDTVTAAAAVLLHDFGGHNPAYHYYHDYHRNRRHYKRRVRGLN